MFRTIKLRKIIKIVLLIFGILIVIPFHPFTHIIYNNSKHFVGNATIFAILQQAKIRELDLENKYQVTAIVLHWKRLLGVQRLIQYYLDSTLFKEIIVWNNNPQINLTYSDIITNKNSFTLIRIINSKENLKDQAKYRACTKARTLACFYADDDWDVSRYAKSLIASFRSDPNLLHSATDDTTYYNNMLWTFMDSKIDLHAGFSWIGVGSVFLREHALRHLQLLMQHIHNPEFFALSDLFFSIWLNDIPSQMVVNHSSFQVDPKQAAEALSATDGFYKLQYKSSVLAIRKLEYCLRNNESATCLMFPRQQNRQFPYCVRSPSPDGEFIFYSNMLYLDIEHIPFNITVHYDRGTYRYLPGGPNYTYAITHSTLNVFDNHSGTCWRTLGMVKKGDFFAIDFLRIQDTIAFSLLIGHSKKLQRSLDVCVSFDGIYWISHPSLKEAHTRTLDGYISSFPQLIFDSRQFSPDLESFRYIAFNATHDFAEIYQVCEIQIIKM